MGIRLGIALAVLASPLAFALAASAQPALLRQPEAKPVPMTDPTKVPSGPWTVAYQHTQVVFWAMHNLISPYYGRFELASGSLTYDAQNLEKSAVDITLDMNRLSTAFENAKGERSLDSTLCLPEALDCAKFPTATFRSTAIKKTGPNSGDITGDFTLHGVTKPVVLHTSFNGMVLGRGGQNVIGFSASGRLKRSDFGVDKAYWNNSISDEVDFLVEAEFGEDTKQ